MKVAEKLQNEGVLNFYKQMALIRRFEEKSAEMYMMGKVRGFLHLYIGEEAIAVGSISAMRPEDYIVTHYRDHGHALARGLDPKAIMAELFGKATGCSKGKGGSMHLFDASRNFMGGYAIVGGQIPLAVGLALAASYRDEKRVVLCFFGDGALNEGEFHECMNLASIWKLPIIFFLENNLYGMGTHIDRTHTGGRDLFKVAAPYRIPAVQVDGMDLMAVREATIKVADTVRSGAGPYLIEALTYRFRGHSMADPVEYREKSEEAQWKKRDPLLLFRNFMLERGLTTEAEVNTLDNEVEEMVEEAVRFADRSPEPSPEALYEDVV